MRIITNVMLSGCVALLAGCGKKPQVDWEARSLEAYVPKEAVARFCSLHYTWRTNATVPVIYGTPDRAQPYFTALREKFPNSWSHLEGGCVFSTVNGKSSQTQAVVRVCNSCRMAEQK